MRYALLVVPFLIAGCSVLHPKDATDKPAQTTAQKQTQTQGQKPAPNQDELTLDDVLKRIKIEVGLYHLYEILNAPDPASQNACHGYVNFQVTKVQATLTTTLSKTNAGNIGLTLPVPAGFTLGLTGTGSDERKQTQILTFSMFPLTGNRGLMSKEDAARVPKDMQTPITDLLISLRKSLLKASEMTPCLALREDNNDVKNTISFAVDVERQGKAGFNFTYAILGLGASHSVDNDHLNKIEVTFEPYLNPPKKGDKPPPSNRKYGIGDEIFGEKLTK